MSDLYHPPTFFDGSDNRKIISTGYHECGGPDENLDYEVRGALRMTTDVQKKPEMHAVYEDHDGGRIYTTCCILDIIRMLDEPEADFVTFVDSLEGPHVFWRGEGHNCTMPPFTLFHRDFDLREQHEDELGGPDEAVFCCHMCNRCWEKLCEGLVPLLY